MNRKIIAPVAAIFSAGLMAAGCTSTVSTPVATTASVQAATTKEATAPSQTIAKRIMLSDRFPDAVKSSNHYVDGDAAVAAVNAATEKAQQEGKRLLIIVGTDICHDTRGLLGWMKQPDSSALIDAHYVRVLVDSGSRKERNLPLLQRFGVSEIKYTPTVLVVDPKTAKLVNADAVSSLGSADSQDPATISDYFNRYAKR